MSLHTDVLGDVKTDVWRWANVIYVMFPNAIVCCLCTLVMERMKRMFASLQMSNYKRATLVDEEVSDAPVDAASSPDRVEVSESTTCCICTHSKLQKTDFYV